MIDKMNKDQRKEILEFLHAEVDRIADEHKRGEGIMDQIERYTVGLSEEDRERFCEDLNKRSAQIDKERSKGKKLNIVIRKD